MTIPAAPSEVHYAGDGVTVAFPIPFVFDTSADIKVVTTDALGTPSGITTGFSITGGGGGTGTCTFDTAPAINTAVTIIDDPDLTQPTDYPDNDAFPASAHEAALDRVTRQVKRLHQRVGRSIRVADGDNSSGDDLLLPLESARAGKFLAFDAEGGPTASEGVGGGDSALREDIASVTFSADGARLVGWRLEKTGSVARSVHAKLADVVSVADFGAFPDGEDCTAELKACFDACIPGGTRVTIPGGTYVVSGPITTSTSITTGSLHIQCDGDVTIQVSGGATAFNTLIKCHASNANSASVCGGRLTLDLNNRCANGIYIRHDAVSIGGTVDMGPVSVIDALNNDASDVNENQAILVYGLYQLVRIDSAYVSGVDRTNTAAGASKGITVSQAIHVIINKPVVSNVLCTGSATVHDADGIAVFSPQGASTNAFRSGSLTIINPVVTDCQGRLIKLQVSESSIVNPVFRRKMVVTDDVNQDIDYQIGGTHELIAPSFEYLLNGVTSPVPATQFPVHFNQACPDRPNRLRVSGGTFRTETAFANFLYWSVQGTSLAGELDVDNVKMQNMGALTTKPVSRSFVEFNAADLQAATRTHIAIRNCRGNFSDAPLLGYAEAAANTNKLSFDLIDNENTGADDAQSMCFSAISGTTITTVASFNLRGNSGFIDFLGNWVFDYRTLKVGCSFSYDRTGATVSNGPTIPAGTRVRAHCVGYDTLSRRAAWAIVDDCNAADTLFYTSTGTWGTIK